MYPTILVVLISLTRSNLEHTIQESAVRAPQDLCPTCMQNPRQEARAEFTETEDDASGLGETSVSGSVLVLSSLITAQKSEGDDFAELEDHGKKSA